MFGGSSLESFFIDFFGVVVLGDVVIDFCEVVQEDNLIAALVEFCEEFVQFGKHEFVVVHLDHSKELLLFEDALFELKYIAHMIS